MVVLAEQTALKYSILAASALAAIAFYSVLVTITFRGPMPRSGGLATPVRAITQLAKGHGARASTLQQLVQHRPLLLELLNESRGYNVSRVLDAGCAGGSSVATLWKKCICASGVDVR